MIASLVALARMAALSKAGTYVGVDLCLKTVRERYGNVPGMGGTAYQAWQRAGGHDGPNTHYSLTAPPGVPVFYKGSGRAGHVAMQSDKPGYIWSTDFKRRGRVDLVKESDLMRGWNMVRLGWSETLNGVRVYPHVSA